MARVSVLLTCFDHIKFLPAAYQSVLDQTFQDIEIIALDDGSTDGTREWLRAHADRAQVIFNESNLGTYGTLNAGLAQANGEFVAVLNDDDVWLPEKLAKQVAMLDADPGIGLVHTDGYFIDGEGNERHDSPLGFDFPRTETGDILGALIRANSIIASAVLVRRECFDQLGGFNPEYFGSGDWEMWYRIAEKWQVGYVTEPLTLYRVHGSNASHKLDRIWRDDLKLRRWIAERIPGYKDRFEANELRALEAHNQACLGTVEVLVGDVDRGRAAYRESLRLEPGRWQSRARLLASYLPRSIFRKLL